MGLFAAEYIAEGTIIWRLDPAIDLRLTQAHLDLLAPACREQIERYTYREKCSGLYVLCGDDARFFNHSPEPNCTDIETEDGGITVTRRAIESGEELTCDYRLFDQDLIEGKYRV
jgi:hypothetical protein